MLRILRHLRNYLSGQPDLETLKQRGLKVGAGFNMLDGCLIDSSHCWLISIGDNVTFAPRVHILAHDASTKRSLGYTRIAKVSIGNNVFLGAGSIVLPGVSIGDDVIVGAGSVVTKSVPSGYVFAGNPARQITTTQEYIQKQLENMGKLPVYDESFTLRGGVTQEKKNKMISELDNGGFVV